MLALARTYFEFFPKVVSKRKTPKHISHTANIIQNAIDNPKEKYQLIIVTEPPRFGKSDLISVHLPAWFLGKYPEKKVISASYSSDLAVNHNEMARNIYKEWSTKLWNVGCSDTMFMKSEWQTNKKGGSRACGVGGSITGYGAELLLIDDYVKGYEDSESVSAREKVWNWWQSVALTRLHPGAVVIILATRWHDDDLIGRIVKEKEKADNEGEDYAFDITYIKLPALAESKDPLGRAEGEPLWEWRYNKKQLLNIQKSVGSYFWSALYQCNPVLRGGNLFKSDSFRYYEFDARSTCYVCWRKDIPEPIIIPKSSLIVHVYVDPSLEVKTKNDPTGMGAWGYSRKYKIWLLLDLINERIEQPQQMGRILQFAYKNSATKIGIENEKLGKVLVKQSAGRDEFKHMKIPFIEIPTGGLDKYTRAVPMATYTENERVFFPKEAHWIASYENQLVSFPNAEHDECVDVTAMAQHMETKRSIAEILANK